MKALSWLILRSLHAALQSSLQDPLASHRYRNERYEVYVRNMHLLSLPARGIRDRGAHALRHTLATGMVDKGVTFKAVSDILGHKSITTTSDLCEARSGGVEASGVALARRCTMNFAALSAFAEEFYRAPAFRSPARSTTGTVTICTWPAA